MAPRCDQNDAPGASDAPFSGHSELHAVGRSCDWARTALGPVTQWPSALRTAVRLCLDSQFPMTVLAGPELQLIYNAGYLPVLGPGKHPGAFGQPLRQVWPEVWPQLQPELERVLRDGEPAAFHERARFLLHRDGRTVETFFDYAYTPIVGDDDRVAGVLAVLQETSEPVRLERDLRRMFELSNDLLAVIGTDERYHRVNSAFTRALGWTEQELLSRPGSSFVHPEDLKRTAEELEHLAQGRPTIQFENRYLHKDGSYRWLSWTAAPVPDEGLIYAAGRDITERKRMDEALRASEWRFRHLADGMPQLVWTATASGIVTHYNSQVARYSGIHATGEGPWSWQPVLHPDDRAHTMAAWQRAVESATTYECEHRVRMADGSYRWHLSRAYRAEASDGAQWYGTATDIHDLKEAQEHLRERERRFKTMADTAPAMLWITNEAGETTFQSRGWYEFTGQVQDDQKLDWMWTEMVHPGDRDRALRMFHDAAARRDSFALDYRLRTAAGEYRWVSDTGRPRFDDDGKFSGYIGAVSDVHERKRAEQELHRLNAELRDAAQRKDEFLAMLGHELRNPLAAMRNATELLKLSAPDDPRPRRVLGVLERQSAHMTRLIDGLLEVSRIARGKIQLNPETVDARRVVDAVLHDRARQLEARGLTLAKVFPERPLWVTADQVRLTQIVDNLAGNAIKFTDAGGRIRVDLGQEGDNAVLRIRDTGIGMRPEMIERLFDPFQQEAQELARSAGGLGLGLALAKGLVELHRGTIAARSDGLGTGTEIEVRLPLAPAPPTHARQETASELTAGRRILIVEDNADAGESLRELLEMLGHEVDLVANGREALALLVDRGADVVLCDLGLPGMSGYDVAREVRKQGSLSDISLIAVTGYGQPEDRRRTAEAGFDAHLTKPVEVAELNAVLEQLSPR